MSLDDAVAREMRPCASARISTLSFTALLGARPGTAPHSTKVLPASSA